MTKMSLRFILKNGAEFTVKCDKIKTKKNGFGQLVSYEMDGIAENQPLHLDLNEVVAVFRVCSDENEGGNEPLTLEELRQMDAPVWCVCKPIEGGDGYWCLCKSGTIITPAGSGYDVAEIPHWVFLRRKPEVVEE